MKKANKSFKVVVDSNIWISFLTGDIDLLELKKIGNTTVIKFSDFEKLVKT